MSEKKLTDSMKKKKTIQENKNNFQLVFDAKG